MGYDPNYGDLSEELEQARERIAELEAALRSVVNHIEEYERFNHLSPDPGDQEDVWQCVTHAKAILRKEPVNG